ncbi:MAG: GntR family transcriptional regulator [Atopobiaceae bacterium]|nr:GntR family transcriptional regulator [Atopobiaceae bacterium]MCI2172661.1 GntR family transcriptional regulator [Atopobiaceae bacterium]MCI2206968.1 GntR family transcriptional regulator [Atopobiaceae bacterium]
MADNTGIRPRDLATEAVRDLIIDEGLTAGSRLPSERDMCATLGCSRATLHSAIGRLVDEGVVTSRVGAGTFVASPRPTINLHGATSFIDSVRGKGHVPGAKVQYAQVEPADGHVAGRLSVALGTPVFTMCRVRLIDDVPSSIETTFIKAEQCSGIERHDFSVESFYTVLREEYGVVPLHGSERLTITFVSAAEAACLDTEAGKPAFRQSAVMMDADGVPVEYFRAVALPRRISFSSERRWRHEADHA